MKKESRDLSPQGFTIIMFVIIGALLLCVIYVPILYNHLTRFNISQDVEALSEGETEQAINDWIETTLRESDQNWMDIDSLREKCPLVSSEPIYKLITTVGHSGAKTDYGTKEMILELKCKRYTEITNSITKYKEIELANEATKRRRDSINDLDLDELNKPCK